MKPGAHPPAGGVDRPLVPRRSTAANGADDALFEQHVTIRDDTGRCDDGSVDDGDRHDTAR